MFFLEKGIFCMNINSGSELKSDFILKIPSINLEHFAINRQNYWINFTADLYDNDKISKIEIDLLSKDGVWKPKYSETEEAETIIEGYSKSIRLLCLVWNSEKNAYDVYI